MSNFTVLREGDKIVITCNSVKKVLLRLVRIEYEVTTLTVEQERIPKTISEEITVEKEMKNGDKIEIKELNKKISKFFKLADTIPINLSESELERYNLVLLNVKKAIDYLLLKEKSYTKYRKKADLLSAQIFKIPEHNEKEKELPRAEEKEEHPNDKAIKNE